MDGFPFDDGAATLTLLAPPPPLLHRAVIKSWPGVSDPFPDVFDPLGFSDKATVDEVRRWRESELTHGELPEAIAQRQRLRS